MSDAADKRIAELERELAGVQQMLYHVLDTVGEEVLVTKEALHRGITGDKMINVVDDAAREAFVFSIVDITDGSDDSDEQ